MANVLKREKQLQVLHLLVEGSSIRACERVTGVHRDTICRLIVKFGSAVIFVPSVAAIWIAAYVPTCADVGVPESLPVAASNTAHTGLFAIVNVIASLSWSLA